MRNFVRSVALAAVAVALPVNAATAVFAGGCFWSTETDMAKVPGVTGITVGYTGGHVAHPTYEQVSSRTTGHREAVLVQYDPRRISYAQLTTAFLHTIDPRDGGGVFCDRGDEYRTAVFVTPQQRADAVQARAQAGARLHAPVATEVLPLGAFYPAEAYHQHYHDTNPIAYKMYRFGCGRDRGLAAVWGKDVLASR